MELNIQKNKKGHELNGVDYEIYETNLIHYKLVKEVDISVYNKFID